MVKATGADWYEVATEWPAPRVRKVYKYSKADEKISENKQSLMSGFVSEEGQQEISEEIKKTYYENIAVGDYDQEDTTDSLGSLVNKVLG